MSPRRARLAPVLCSCVSLLTAACVPEEPPPPPSETEVAPGWVLARPFPDVLSLQDVVTLSPTRAYAVGSGLALLRYDEGTWTREDPPAGVDTGATLESVSAVLDEESGAETVLAVGEGGLVLLRAEGGWTPLESGTDVHLFGVWVRALDDAFIVGDDGTILRFVDGAVVSLEEEALQDRDLPDGTTETYRIPEALKAVAGRGPEDVYVVGLAGSIYHFDGDRFRRQASTTRRPFTDVFTGAGVMATATDGIVFRLQEGGWDDRLRTPVPLYLQGVWASSWDDVYAVGMAGTIFHHDGAAWSSTALDSPSHLRAIDGVYEVIESEGEEPVVRRTVFAVGAGGRILRGPSARAEADQPETEQGG